MYPCEKIYHKQDKASEIDIAKADAALHRFPFFLASSPPFKLKVNPYLLLAEYSSSLLLTRRLNFPCSLDSIPKKRLMFLVSDQLAFGVLLLVLLLLRSQQVLFLLSPFISFVDEQSRFNFGPFAITSGHSVWSIGLRTPSATRRD